MKLYLAVFVFLFLSINVYSQDIFKVYSEIHIDEINRRFQIGHVIKEGYEITSIERNGKLYYIKSGTPKNEATKDYPVNMVIRILNEHDVIVKDIIIDFNDVDIDLSGFGIKYFGSRNFITVNVGRFQRYILNLSKLKIIGPIRPYIEGGEFGDGQDGNPIFLRVFDDGQYLIGCLTGMGYFCYNLMDLYNPVQVDYYCCDDCIFNGKYFFLDKRKENIYNGLLVEVPKYMKINAVFFLFQGLKFELDESNSIITRKIKNRYLVLHQIKDNGDKSPLIIDYLEGRILDYEKDRELIKDLIASD